MAGSFNIFWCVAMCRNPACPRFLWVSRNWVGSEQHALQPLQDLIHGLCMAHSDILEIKTLVKNESMKQLQHILLGSGERLYAEWLFAQDSHHLSHRISSAISQSLHTCRPIRKHCMYCRNLLDVLSLSFTSLLFHCVACIVEVFCDDLTISLPPQSSEPCDFHGNWRKGDERSMWIFNYFWLV